jgi:hypothetical protein
MTVIGEYLLNQEILICFYAAVILTAAKSSGIWEKLAFQKVTEPAIKPCCEFPEFFDVPKMSKNRNLPFK